MDFSHAFHHYVTSFKSRKPKGELVVVSHGWQSEDTAETTGG